MKLFRFLIGLGLAVLVGYLLWLPDVRTLRTHHPPKSALMLRREAQARHKGRKPVSHFYWRDVRNISPFLVHAVLVAEDDTFYRHSGFDFEQIRIAFERNWKQKRFAYGGSTITQQLARTLYLSPDKNLIRKAKEALITILLEHSLSKARILELYLNYAEWGRGVYGAEAAAQVYFNRPASDLTPDQAIALASILPSPRRWSPFSERAFMARRRTQLYERMRASGYLPEEGLPNLAPPPQLDELQLE